MLKKIFESLNLFGHKKELLENYQNLFDNMKNSQVAIISVYDNTSTSMENKRAHNKFKTAMVNSGYKVYSVKGAFEVENPTPPYIDKMSLIIVTPNTINKMFEQTISLYGGHLGAKFFIYIDDGQPFIIGLSKNLDKIPFKNKIKFKDSLLKPNYNSDKLISYIKKIFK